MGIPQMKQIKEKKGVYAWLLSGWEVVSVGPEGPGRSPGGLERSLLMELLQMNALLSILHDIVAHGCQWIRSAHHGTIKMLFAKQS